MQAGFSLLEAGSVRAKNTKDIFLKNLLDIWIGGIGFITVGYAFGFGKGNGFIGYDCFFLSGCEDYYSQFMFQWAFCSTASAIVGGPLAERTQFSSYVIHSSLITVIAYPLAAHWVWNSGGWLYNLEFIDSSGASVVHLIGGVVGFCGAFFVGPRIGRFGSEPTPLMGHNVGLSIFGTFILWYGWYGFNCGPTWNLGENFDLVSARVAVNTTISASITGVTTMVLDRVLTGHYHTETTLNGIVSGLVASTSGCSVNEPWSFAIIGVITSGCFLATSRLVSKLKVDDPLDAVAVHFSGGVISLLSTGAFANPDYVKQALKDHTKYGFLYGGGGGLMVAQLIGTAAILAWAVCFGVIVFGCLHRVGLLRVSYESELVGLDNAKHGGPAYPEFTV